MWTRCPTLVLPASVWTAVLFCVTPPAGAQCELQKLIVSDAAPDARFGSAIAMDGDRLVVGARDDEGTGWQGSAYVFVRDDNGTPNDRSDDRWLQEAKLFVPRSRASSRDRFGTAVAISGNRIAIGANGDSEFASFAGAVYVFRHDGSTWLQEAKLTWTTFADFFGTRVSMHGNRIVVGVPFRDALGRDSGACYVYEWNGVAWMQTAELLASGGGIEDRFGISVAIRSDDIVVGADQESTSGAAYVFRHDGSNWIEDARFAPGDLAQNARFGRSVSLHDDLVAVGAPRDAPSDNGSAYVFRRKGSSWVREMKLSTPNPSFNGLFGDSVAISDTHLVVGAVGESAPIGQSGAAHLFRHDGSVWNHVDRIEGSDLSSASGFGGALAIDAWFAFVGATGDAHLYGRLAGSVTAYLIGGADGDGDGRPDTCDACPGFDDRLDADNDKVPDACDVCPGGNDRIDSDGDGVPDFCDSEQCELAILTASDSADGNGFGWAISSDQGIVAVGARNADSQSGLATGAVYAYERIGANWLERDKLFAADAQGRQLFGLSVDVAGQRIVVGAPDAFQGAAQPGAVYVFRRDAEGWLQEDKLLATSQRSANLGMSVASTGDRIVAGDSGISGSTGAAFVFGRVGLSWEEDVRLTASNGTPGDGFGASVAIDRDWIVVGAPLDDDGASGSGSAYVFHRVGKTWMEEAKLTAPVPVAGANFGRSIAIAGDWIVVAAPEDHLGEIAWAGSAYVFHWDGLQWVFDARLNAGDAGEYDNFGSSVAISGERVVVGAWKDWDVFVWSGAAYVFKRTSDKWQQEAKLVTFDPREQDHVGGAVSIDGTQVAVSTTRFGGGRSTLAGRAHVFAVLGNDRNGNEIPDECELRVGDLNCDGAFNGGDIDVFFLAVGDPAQYAARFPDCDRMLADMNADGVVNGADIDPFFACLGGNCP